MDDARPARRAEALALLDALESEAPFPGPPRVGLTGPPGAGKSTLLDALVQALRERGRSIGIAAVDPSSQRSGGALLGDRVRVRARSGDPGVFFRSMAARERLGGLADATHPSITILAAAFDAVFVESVGVGQSEAEIAHVVDSTVYVAEPGAGDALQFMKAGILELPDLFAVNKADREDAARTASELASSLGLSERERDGWTPPVLLVSARDRRGIEELALALERHREHLLASGKLAQRRRRARESFVVEALLRRYGSYGVARVGGAEGVCKRVAEAGASSFALVREMGGEIEQSLRA